MSERLPRTGSLGIVLMAGVGLGMAGAVGVPVIGKVADRFLAEALPPAETLALLERVDAEFPAYLQQAQGSTDAASLGYSAQDVGAAIDATDAALAEYAQSGTIANDATANALRAVTATQLPNEPLVADAGAILQPADMAGGQASFRYVAPTALILVLVFGVMYVQDRRRGGYRAVRLERESEPIGAI